MASIMIIPKVLAGREKDLEDARNLWRVRGSERAAERAEYADWMAAIIGCAPEAAERRVQGSRLDRNYLVDNAPILGVADLLSRALREATA